MYTPLSPTQARSPTYRAAPPSAPSSKDSLTCARHACSFTRRVNRVKHRSSHDTSSLRMPSRQERRKAERDAAKRAPAQAAAAGAAGAAGAAAALANLRVNMNPGGDWTTQAADSNLLLRALGAETVKQRAGEGDMEAQWSWSCRLLGESAGAEGTPLSAAAGTSPKADVGFALCTALFPFAHQIATRRCGHHLATIWFVCGCQP